MEFYTAVSNLSEIVASAELHPNDKLDSNSYVSNPFTQRIYHHSQGWGRVLSFIYWIKDVLLFSDSRKASFQLVLKKTHDCFCNFLSDIEKVKFESEALTDKNIEVLLDLKIKYNQLKPFLKLVQTANSVSINSLLKQVFNCSKKELIEKIECFKRNKHLLDFTVTTRTTIPITSLNQFYKERRTASLNGLSKINSWLIRVKQRPDHEWESIEKKARWENKMAKQLVKVMYAAWYILDGEKDKKNPYDFHLWMGKIGTFVDPTFLFDPAYLPHFKLPEAGFKEMKCEELFGVQSAHYYARYAPSLILPKQVLLLDDTGLYGEVEETRPLDPLNEFPHLIHYFFLHGVMPLEETSLTIKYDHFAITKNRELRSHVKQEAAKLEASTINTMVMDVAIQNAEDLREVEKIYCEIYKKANLAATPNKGFVITPCHISSLMTKFIIQQAIKVERNI